MRRFLICFIVFLFGCGDENSAPPPFVPEDRETIKQHLINLGAKVTADVPEGLYLSLRNTHVEVRELGGIIEGTFDRRRDIQDFGETNEAVGKGFLEADEFEAFKRWLHEALAPRAPNVMRSEYKRFKVTLARKPLRTIFTRKHAPEAE